MTAPYPWVWFLNIFLGLGCLFVLIVVIGLRWPARTLLSFLRLRVSQVVISFGTFGFAWIIWTAYSEYLDLMKAYQAGLYRDVTGRISDFSPYQPGHQSPVESFRVEDVRFSYNARELHASYNRRDMANKPIADGDLVKITYIPDGTNHIIKLALCETK
jgi:hypothetical protein